MVAGRWSPRPVSVSPEQLLFTVVATDGSTVKHYTCRERVYGADWFDGNEGVYIYIQAN